MQVSNMQSDDYNRKQPGLRQGLTYIAQEVWDGWGGQLGSKRILILSQEI